MENIGIEYKEMIEQLEILKNEKLKIIKNKKLNDKIKKQFNALDDAITYLNHYYPGMINEYKIKIEQLENKEKQNYLKNEMLEDLLHDYRRMYQLIYKLIENKE